MFTFELLIANKKSARGWTLGACSRLTKTFRVCTVDSSWLHDWLWHAQLLLPQVFGLDCELQALMQNILRYSAMLQKPNLSFRNLSTKAINDGWDLGSSVRLILSEPVANCYIFLLQNHCRSLLSHFRVFSDELTFLNTFLFKIFWLNLEVRHLFCNDLYCLDLNCLLRTKIHCLIFVYNHVISLHTGSRVQVVMIVFDWFASQSLSLSLSLNLIRSISVDFLDLNHLNDCFVNNIIFLVTDVLDDQLYGPSMLLPRDRWSLLQSVSQCTDFFWLVAALKLLLVALTTLT